MRRFHGKYLVTAPTIAEAVPKTIARQHPAVRRLLEAAWAEVIACGMTPWAIGTDGRVTIHASWEQYVPGPTYQATPPRSGSMGQPLPASGLWWREGVGHHDRLADCIGEAADATQKAAAKRLAEFTASRPVDDGPDNGGWRVED